jgi:hypothetical protein
MNYNRFPEKLRRMEDASRPKIEYIVVFAIVMDAAIEPR